ncbi:hypothetical protein PV762_03080 [Mitsuaria sp. CC2]|uniref:hypothetical protein n=1 Tax=Mitsuaria sp. CC2 TaxID=3029186 RepID=UPI003B8C32EC
MRTLFVSGGASDAARAPAPVRELTLAEIEAVSGGQYQVIVDGQPISFTYISGGVKLMAGGQTMEMGFSEDGDTFNMNYNGHNLEFMHMGDGMFDVTLDGVGLSCVYVGPK